MKKIEFTLHALDKLQERGLSPEWVTDAIRNPDSSRPDPRDPSATLAFKRIPERDLRVLRVVFVEDNEAVRVITAFLDRRA